MNVESRRTHCRRKIWGVVLDQAAQPPMKLFLELAFILCCDELWEQE